MKIFGWTAALSLILVGWAGSASADPDKDESGHGRWRGGYERNYDGPRRGYGYGYERPRRASAAPSSRNSTTAGARLSASGSATASTRKSASAAADSEPIRLTAIGINHGSQFADGPLRFINQRCARGITAR